MSIGDGILCPLCSGPTGVIDTRQQRGRTRRTRQCLNELCTGRLTTVELREDVPPPGMVLVRRSVLRRLRKIVKEICSPSVVDERSCESPEGSGIPVIE